MKQVKNVRYKHCILNSRKHDPPLITLSQEGMTMSEIDSIAQNVELHGFPIVFSKESQYLFGYIEKRDLKMCFGIKLLINVSNIE